MSLRSVIRQNPNPLPVALPHDFLDEVVSKMVETGRNAVIVMESGTILRGIITDHDIIRAVHKTQSLGRSIESSKASDWMSHNVVTCDVSAKLNEVLKLMGRHKIRHIVAMDAGKPTAIISIRDILSKMHEQDELEVKVLRDLARSARVADVA
ncbi:histidine kinase [Litorimonas cladophorae]|uniref:Histidine kinase n=1 Tax=Litorimonas cladophorae TaxID=1220491 RepID=A0A918NBI4_9PROT|nr:CBS domain-containing protein [Litorimonas cladophorae]GGX56338.1 histidine kinase [Litorimonas cladophorae]